MLSPRQAPPSRPQSRFLVIVLEDPDSREFQFRRVAKAGCGAPLKFPLWFICCYVECQDDPISFQHFQARILQTAHDFILEKPGAGIFRPKKSETDSVAFPRFWVKLPRDGATACARDFENVAQCSTQELRRWCSRTACESSSIVKVRSRLDPRRRDCGKILWGLNHFR